MPSSMNFLQEGKEGCRIQLEVHPSSSFSTIELPTEWRERLIVRLYSPAKDGAANRELKKVLSKILTCSKSDIIIISGERSRKKTVIVKGISTSRAEKSIKEALMALKRGKGTI